MPKPQMTWPEWRLALHAEALQRGYDWPPYDTRLATSPDCTIEEHKAGLTPQQALDGYGYINKDATA